jgi:hypothetical protein
LLEKAGLTGLFCFEKPGLKNPTNTPIFTNVIQETPPEESPLHLNFRQPHRQ